MIRDASAELAELVTQVAQLGSSPVVIRFQKLAEFAESAGLNIRAQNDVFMIYRGGKTLFSCDTTDELNDWFIEFYAADVLN